ncbi:hypothetical protein ACFWPH_34465 [Nocardia sp. NPDC058499]|uniref:hypothetical protein n=1 Tax=Nocardia sp. NPDC058499 TaxID=3346530 RepID=UPI003663BDE3
MSGRVRWRSGPDRDLWTTRHRDCESEAGFDSLGEAIFVRTAHGGHGPECLQSLSAVAYLGGHNDDDHYE